MNKQETIADIIAEMRRGTRLPGYWRSCDVNEILQHHADRLEAAWKREKATAENSSAVGNTAKLREALEAIIEICDDKRVVSTREERMVVYNIAKVAFAAPARNCDVGTAEEQSRRFCAFCRPRLEPCDGCPCLEGSRHGRCEFVWAQMPYEEGGANE